MKVRDVVRFLSSLPEDIIETEDGRDFVQPPGKSVADALADIFRKLGLEVYYGPAPRGDFMWELGVRKGRHAFGAVLNLVEDYVLTLDNLSWTDGLFGRPKFYIMFLNALSREMDADPRFSDIRWFTRRDAGSGVRGAATPVG